MYTSTNRLPKDFELVDRDGNSLQVYHDSCPGYHGFTYIGNDANTIVTGCGEKVSYPDAGFVMVMQITDELKVKKLSYPHNNLRSSRVYSYTSMGVAIGNYGSRATGFHAIVRIDPSQTAIAASDILEFPSSSWPESALTGAYSTCFLDIQRGGTNQVITVLPDGFMHVFDSNTLAKVGAVDLFPHSRSELSRADFSCVGTMEVKVEVGNMYAIVYYTTNDTFVRVNLDTLTVEAMAQPQSFSLFGDAIVAIPGGSQRFPSCTSGALSSTTVQPPNVGSSSSSDDDLKSTVTVLSVMLAIVVVLLLIVVAASVYIIRQGKYKILIDDNGSASTAVLSSV